MQSGKRIWPWRCGDLDGHEPEPAGLGAAEPELPIKLDGALYNVLTEDVVKRVSLCTTPKAKKYRKK